MDEGKAKDPCQGSESLASGGVMEVNKITPETESVQLEEEIYSIYNPKEKWLIVVLVAVAGLFRYFKFIPTIIANEVDQRRSPLPANIYFPAIPTLVNIFHKSTELLNVTVTVYLVMQGVCTFSAFSCCSTPL